MATSVLADDDEYKGDGYSQSPVVERTRWVGFVYAAIGVAGVAVVGFKNAKRTHLD